MSGDVKAELSGLVKRLPDLGVSGNGTIDYKQYEGILQGQLAETLKDIRQCKATIFDTLQKKLLADLPQQPARDQNGEITQSGVNVGRTFGARRLPNDATMFEFSEIMNCAQFNTNEPFYYNGIRMKFVSEKNSTMIDAGRVQDSPIGYGVLAKITD